MLGVKNSRTCYICQPNVQDFMLVDQTFKDMFNIGGSKIQGLVRESIIQGLCYVDGLQVQRLYFGGLNI